MKKIITFIIALMWCWAPFVALHGQGLKSFLSGGVTTSSGPVTFVAATGNNFATTRSPSLTYPTCSTNDILIAFFCADGTADYTGSPPAGWSYINHINDGVVDETGAAFWARVDGTDVVSGETKIWTNITAANETGRVIILAYTNCKLTGSPINTSSFIGRGSVTAHDTSSITPSVDNCMIIGAFCIDPGADPRTFTWDGGITELIDSGTTPTGQNALDAGLHIGEYLQATAAAITLGGDFPSAENSVAIALALAPQ